MVVKMINEQISTMWPLLKYGILSTNEIPDSMADAYSTEILTNLLCGKYQVWLGFDRSDKGVEPYAFMVTCVKQNELYKEKFLYIDCLFGFRHLSDENLRQDFGTILQFARDLNCKRIKAHTKWPRVKELLAMSNFKTTEIQEYEFKL